jgi:hypothetical protein
LSFARGGDRAIQIDFDFLARGTDRIGARGDFPING